jgi:abortive infection bacteriophage resistance protein
VSAFSFVGQNKYSKSYLIIPEQLELLGSRGMVVINPTKAAHALRRIGYYRLSGYWYPFRQSQLDSETGTVCTLDEFRPGTSFDQALDLYVFDRQLRLLFLDAIERIEVALRVEIALLLGRQGAYAHRQPQSFRPSFNAVEASGSSPHERWVFRQDELFGRSREEFASHFRHKYDGHPPLWIAIEIWDFGTLTGLLHGMKDTDQNELASTFLLQRRNVLVSLCQSLNFVRNICAHHGRLWNRPIVQQPAVPKPGEIHILDHLVEDRFAQQRLYAVAALTRYLLRTINPETTWPERLKDLFARFPGAAGVAPVQAGFPEGWEELELWRR